VAILDVALVSPTQPWHALHQLLSEPHLHVLRVQPDLDPLADHPARHRIVVPLNVDHAAGIDTRHETTADFQPTYGQWMQYPQLFVQSFAAARVELIQQPTQELRVSLAVGKVPAATHHQSLVQRTLEAVMSLLDVAVLVAVIGLCLLTDQAVMIQQPLVASCELVLVGQVIHRRAQPIRAMAPWNATQIMQSVLQALTEALETL
jgi:hypothetical protein